MLLELLISIIIGIIAGAFTGLMPGIHINLVLLMKNHNQGAMFVHAQKI